MGVGLTDLLFPLFTLPAKAPIWLARSLKEAAEFAGEMCVTLALQNHEPVIRDHFDMLDMIREVDSPRAVPRGSVQWPGTPRSASGEAKTEV